MRETGRSAGSLDHVTTKRRASEPMRPIRVRRLVAGGGSERGMRWLKTARSRKVRQCPASRSASRSRSSGRRSAVEIEGEPYWDGGYLGNPALFPLFYETVTDDILLMQINPIERRATPRTAHEIQNRLTEITFNGNLLNELRVADFVTRLIESGKLSANEYKHVLMHRITGGAKLDAFTASSHLCAEWSFFQELKDLGRTTAKQWLAENYDAIGVRGTLNLRAA